MDTNYHYIVPELSDDMGEPGWAVGHAWLGTAAGSLSQPLQA